MSEYTYCDTCGTLATHAVFDAEEIPAAPGEFRQFRETVQRAGCAEHPAVAFCHYLDGRILRVSECTPERVPSLASDDSKSSTAQGNM